jgi:hypothetical protein
VTIAKLRSDAVRWGATLERQSRRCFEAWLSEVAGSAPGRPAGS